jgi:predicted membrane-bound spermidine synthase
MRAFILSLSLAVALVFCGSAEISITKTGNYITVVNGGPLQYHIDTNDVFRLVDPSNQLMGVATEMVIGHHHLNNYPTSVYDIGLGVACLPRYFLHRYPSMTINAADIDSRVIIKYGELYRNYMQTAIPKSELTRMTIAPSNGEDLVSSGMLQASQFDAIWLDILDDNYKSKENLLFKRDFFDVITKRLTENGALIVALYKATSTDVSRIKNFSKISNGVHLTYSKTDVAVSGAQKDFSVLILGGNIVNCQKLEASYKTFGNSININRPICKIV